MNEFCRFLADTSSLCFNYKSAWGKEKGIQTYAIV